MQAFCNNKLTFYIQYSAANVFSFGFKAVSEPPVPEHVQRKEHIFQELTIKIDLGIEYNLHNHYPRRYLDNRA